MLMDDDANKSTLCRFFCLLAAFDDCSAISPSKSYQTGISGPEIDKCRSAVR